MERHTLFADRPLARVPRLGRPRRRRHQRRPRRASPADRVRLHVCWGNYEGPHTHDVPLDDIQPQLYAGPGRRARAVDGQRPPRPRAPLLRARARCPTGMLLVTGVIDTTSNYVEHPEVVADRLARGAPGGRRPAPRHRRHRLRVRHVGRHRRRRPVGGLGEAAPRSAPAPTWRQRSPALTRSLGAIASVVRRGS